jgi:EpsI family protein
MMAILAAELPHAKSSGWTTPVALYGVFVALCVLALQPTAFAMAQTWLSSSSYHHGVVVAPLAVWMIMSRPHITPATGPLSLVAIAAAAMLWLAGHAASVALVEQVAFVSLLIAGAGAVFGANALRVWALPLLFLYFMVPFGETLIPFLQQMTAHAVIGLLNFFGMTATLDGVLITTQVGVFEIARACAGLNFLLAALMIACVYACQTLHNQRVRASFVVIAAVVAIAANFLRAFLLILVATLSDMRFAVGADHLAIGFVFYGAIFFLLFWIGAKMRNPKSVGPEHAPIAPRRPWRPLIAAATMAPVIAVSAYAAFVVDFTMTLPSPPRELTLNAPGWRILPPPENWKPALDADRIDAATYDKHGDRVYVYHGYIVQDRAGREIVSAANTAADGREWRSIATLNEVVYLFGQSEKTPLEVLAGPDRRRLLIATVYWRGDAIYTDKIAFKWAQMNDRLRGRNPAGGVIMIGSDYVGAPSEALQRIRAFTSDVESFTSWRKRNGGAS